jgi:hypothetical protein
MHLCLNKFISMKKFLIVSVALLLMHFSSFAQSAKAVFVEAGGPGLFSFNFDTRFSGKETGIGARVGMGGFKLENAGAVFVPITLNYVVGKNTGNYFEFGAGATFVPSTSAEEDGPLKHTSGHLNFGYRHQPAEGGFFFRATINPIFGEGYFWPYYGGLSFGYKF